MVRAKHGKGYKPKEYHCGMCNESFHTRGELNEHVSNHPDNAPSGLSCSVCRWPFDDSHLLEQHRLQSGHGAPEFACGNCGETFISKRGLDDHIRNTVGCQNPLTVPSVVQITCDRCPNIFSNKREYEAHRSFPNGPCADHKKRTPPKPQPVQAQPSYINLERPKQLGHYPIEYDDSAGTPDNLSEGEEYCHDCKRTFHSKATFNLHALSCLIHKTSNTVPLYTTSASATAGKPALQPVTAAKSQRQPVNNENFIEQGHRATNKALQATAPQKVVNNTAKMDTTPAQSQPPKGKSNLRKTSSVEPAGTNSAFVCEFPGCGMTFGSNGGLKVHQGDRHGIGGKPLDPNGRDSWMLSQKNREQLRAAGVLRKPTDTHQGGVIGGNSAPVPTRSENTKAQRPSSALAVQPVAPTRPRERLGPSIVHHAPPQPSLPSGPIDIAAEMEQARLIQGQILRVLIQEDIFIQHGGSMTVGDIEWVRIQVSKQKAAAKQFEAMCHLPKILQNEYLPHPKGLALEYTAQYPIGDFQHSPESNSSRPRLGIVALSCSKVVLSNGCREIVKVAAIDLMTCRILLNHLVCTNSNAKVADWHSKETGLSSWRDIEEARLAGYKVFKGWSAARSALWKFVDRETIIVGHNLRSDLDALRMIHGRAVDIAKVVEKAAQGSLSKVQLSLDSLYRTYIEKELKSDPQYGRDSLVNAFAVRELGLCFIKNQEKLNKVAKQKSLEYQKAAPKARA